MNRAHDLSQPQDAHSSVANSLPPLPSSPSARPHDPPRAGDLLQLGFVAPLCLAAHDAEQALQCACRFGPLWSQLPFRLECTEADLSVHAPIGGDAHEPAHRSLVNVVMLWVRLFAAVTAARVGPQSVQVPARVRPELRRLLDCPIYEDERQVVVAFLRVEAREANPAADAALFRVLTGHAEQRLFDFVRAHTTSALVRRALLRLAEQSDLSAERLGRELGLGIRTLHRRLSAEGTSFRKLLREFQVERCLRELESGHVSAKQVAFALGFADPASFHRAFKRWTGRTVTEYRAALRGQDHGGPERP